MLRHLSDELRADRGVAEVAIRADANFLRWCADSLDRKEAQRGRWLPGPQAGSGTCHNN